MIIYDMASTQQSAVDYIRNGRVVLINGLRNLILILQTLKQRTLLSDSEKDFILDEDVTRLDQIGRLLDLVTSKGEDACYELLRILDDTRFQTFPMPGVQQPDLHHWISCFPFTNDPNVQSDDNAGSGPCSKYQKQLKMKAAQILHEKWKQSMNVLKHKAKEKSFKYIPLVLDTDVSVIPHTKIKAYKKTRTKKLKTYIPTDKRRLSPYDLLLSNEKKILLIGKPGIGKTTVVQEILRLWANGEDSQVSYMFYFDEPFIRFLSQSACSESLSCLLFNKYLKPSEGSHIVWKDLEENSENVVIIFDGIMDFVAGSVIEKIMEKEILNDAKILITCRPEADSAGDLSDWTSFKVEVQGFSENSIKAYFQWMLGTNDEQMTSVSAANNLQLFSLCHVPMYAFIISACILFSPSEADNRPCTITEMYVRIFLHCIALHMDRNMDNLDQYIQERKENIMFLASQSYQALLFKTVNLAEISKTDIVQHDFLTQVTLEGEGTSTSSQTAFVFLHNTMQEFWAALFLLMTPHKIGHLLQQSQTEEGKYLKYVVIFLCGLLSEKTAAFLKSLVTIDEIKAISTKYFDDIMNAFLYSIEDDDDDDDDDDTYVEAENVLYVCQCLYEYRKPEACLRFLQKVENMLDLNDQPLDPHQCCAVSYVVSQSSSQTVQLNLMNCSILNSGIKLILSSLTNLKSLRLSSSSMQCQIWMMALQESKTDFESLLRLFGFEMHLSAQNQSDSNTFHNACIVLNGKRQNKVKLCLHLNTQKKIANSLLKNIFGSLHNIADIRIISPDYPRRTSDTWNSEVDSFHLDLFLQGALHDKETGQMCVRHLLSVNRHLCSRSPPDQSNFICTLYLHAKQMGVLAELQPVFQAWPSYWVLDLSKRNTSYLVELLKLQKVKKIVELWLSKEECEIRVFLQCLPYVSQLRFNDYIHIQEDDTKAAVKLLVDLFICASESGDDQTLKMLSAVCSYSSFPFTANMEEIQSVFLWDLFSYIRDYESKNEGKSVLPTLLPVFQSVPAVWIVDLSKETPVILHVLKHQVVKKPIELSHWSDEADKVDALLQCLPHVSQLSLRYSANDHSFARGEAVRFIMRLFLYASESGDHGTLKMLSSVCSYSTFPFAVDMGEIQSVFLLDLYSCVMEYESQTEKSVLPALLPIYQTAPAVWVLDLSKGVTSLLHQTMQLQKVKKPIDLLVSSDRRDLVDFLQCLPCVAQLRLEQLLDGKDSDTEVAVDVILELFLCALEKGEATLRMLASVCCYSTFPFADDAGEIQSVFLLDLHSKMREIDSQTGKSVLPALLPIYQTAPAVWVLDLSKGVTSLLHQTMQLQAVKRPVELRGWSHNKMSLKFFLQCLPFVSQLRFNDLSLVLKNDINGAVKILVELLILASEGGDEILKMFLGVCSYSTFPFADDTGEIQSVFLLDLYSCVMEYESQTGKSVLPALLPIYQTAPAVWVLDLSKGVTSLLHQTMQLQAVKRPVELRGWSADESELRNILECAPHVLQLNCSEHFFQTLCEVLSASQDWNPEKVAGLLKTLNFSVTLMEMLPKRICQAVGLVLGWTSLEKSLSVTLIPQSVSCQGICVLFSKLTRLQKLRMNEYAALKVSKMVSLRSQRSVTIEELSLVSNNPYPSGRRMCKMIHSLASILRIWTVRCLDLTESHLEGHFLILLLCLDRPFSIRMSDENVHQLAEIVYEAQDDILTQSFLEKVSGDLSSSSFPWNILHYLLQKSKIPLTVDPQKNRFATINIQHLLPLLHRIHFNGTDSQFVRNALKEIFASRAGHLVTSLVRTSDNWINLNKQELDSHDCTALRFALHYSDDVRLNLSETAIPKEETESILILMHRVSNLRVDRHLLVDLLHACFVSREQRRVTTSLMMAIQNKLDFSYPSTVSQLEESNREPMVLSVTDCKSISSAIQLSACADLIMFDCQADDCALEQLFPALSHMRLRLGKPQLLQLILLIQCVGERDSWNRAKALSIALGKEVDLSHTPLDYLSCKSLGLVLENSEDLTHLNLSHCQLTDDCLDLLLPHLHKVQLLDLSNNNITDYGALSLQKILTKTQTIHIFNNLNTDMRLFIKNLHYQETQHNSPTYVQSEKEDFSKCPFTNDSESVFVMKALSEIFTKRITTVAKFDPEIYVHDDHIVYRFECEMGGEFQCRATELIFGMKGRGCVEYRVVNWDMHYFSKHIYKPDGPLYDIQTLVGEMYLLHLPHCETEADGLEDVFVAHIHEGSMQILTPVKMTCTHVTVRISGLSSYGKVRRKGSMTRYVRGQVLLFLDQISKNEQRIWVFLLSKHVSPIEVKKQQKEYTPINTTSYCILRQKGKYCLTSNLQNCKVQPKLCFRCGLQESSALLTFF
ncbi:uncharacterized protein LOC113568372 isoform X2 [Electrophorus electricus]|uniref:uncharacterized protein LOC113568372 isoform X2 n=1 Tax=Electrophorus electricus TaxID=8005 RepID=UPI0015D0A36A|nr:uncharacterized protein LOC113568372 isoform X2 [Electrophorus electricus]